MGNRYKPVPTDVVSDPGGVELGEAQHFCSFKYQNGDRVRDKVSGFEGIVVGRTQWLNGCVRYVVMSEKLGKDNIPVEINIDEDQALLVKSGVIRPQRTEESPPGGPRSFEPTRRSTIR